MRPSRHPYAVPGLVAAASVVGLVSGLLGDGVWDALSWLTLGGAAALGAWYALRRAPKAR